MRLPKYIPEFDGLRGLAVLSVIALHISLYLPALHFASFVSCGWVGVDLFFVISGFLITGILLSTREKAGYFRRFYARRVVRIFPLYYAVLFVTFCVLPVAMPAIRESVFQKNPPWLVQVMYLQNFWPQQKGSLSITWSLAIEEQFYLLWPLIVYYCGKRTLQRILVGILLVSPILRMAIAWLQLPLNAYRITPTRLDGLAAGSLLALWISSAEGAEGTVRSIAPWIAGGAALAFAAVQFTSAAGVLGFSLLAICFAAVLALVLANVEATKPWSRLLRTRALRFTGKISYGLYLLHILAFDLVAKSGLARRLPATGSVVVNDLLRGALMLCSAFAIASLSWYAFESPLLSLKSRFDRPRPPRATDRSAETAYVTEQPATQA